MPVLNEVVRPSLTFSDYPVFRMVGLYGGARATPKSAVTSPSEHIDLKELILAVAQGRDQAAYARLFEYFAPRIKTLMIRFGADSFRADELAQEAMLTVWRKAGMFDPGGTSASGWIYRIARNLYIDAVRRDRRAAALPREKGIAIAQPDSIFAKGEDLARVRAAIGQLSQEQERVLIMSFFDDRPHTEIATQLRLPLGTVKSRLRLALQRLRMLLDESNGQGNGQR